MDMDIGRDAIMFSCVHTSLEPDSDCLPSVLMLKVYYELMLNRIINIRSVIFSCFVAILMISTAAVTLGSTRTVHGKPSNNPSGHKLN